MHKAKRGRAKTYNSDHLMFRSVLGVLLIALGILSVIAVVGGIQGAIFAPIKQTVQGLGGSFCLGIPLFLIWAGILIAFSARQKVPVRAFLFLSVFYMSFLGIINLLSTVGTTPLMEYTFAYNQGQTALMANAQGYWETIRGAYQLCSGSGELGGALGMATAWPMWTYIGSMGGVTILGVLSMICVLFFTKFDLIGSWRSFKEKSEQRITQKEMDRETQSYLKKMQKQQALEQRQSSKNSYSSEIDPRSIPAQMAPQTAGVAINPLTSAGFLQTMMNPANMLSSATSGVMPGGSSAQASDYYANQPNNKPTLYDEMIVPEVPDGAVPSGFKLKNLFGRHTNETPANAVPTAMEKSPTVVPTVNMVPQDRDAQRVLGRMEENRRRKNEIDRQLHKDPVTDTPQTAMSPEVLKAIQDARMAAKGQKPVAISTAGAGESLTPPLAVPFQKDMFVSHESRAVTDSMAPEQVTFTNQVAQYQHPTVEDARLTAAQIGVQNTSTSERFSAYKRPMANTSTPMSGQRLDQPDLKLTQTKPKSEQPALAKQPCAYPYPMIELLNLRTYVQPDTRDVDRTNALNLENTLKSFGIPAKVQRVTHGPAVTRFELGLISSGINVKRIMNISDNIALDMAANGGVRIEVPIPGTNLFGVEVPNKEIMSVSLAEVLTSPEMTNAKSPLSVALGKDIAGRPVICDLAKMPHLLIAGQTGSGKSVCINSIINSLLYRATPEEVRMIMIDPKVVELQGYNKVPHLLIPVVSDPHKASGALAWAVQEMLDRYHKMQSKGVREITNYNAKVAPGEEKLPRIVIIIDELSDLMLACKKEVEESIIRLAQLARAAGIHVIVATQRPTVNVITGLIKANIPSRIAFAVASSIDSRTILDMNGAEKLLGKGDMFYYPTGEKAPLRVQGCYVSDQEITNIVDYIGENSNTDYDERINEIMDSSTPDDVDSTVDVTDDGNNDDRLQEAVEMILTDGQASISMLQRRMKIGYARAGRLIDEMASRGIVSKSAGSKPREILITYEQYLQQQDTFLR